MKIGAPHRVAATAPVPSTAKHDSEKSPLPDQFDASSKNKQTAPSENQQEQCLPKVRVSTKTGKSKFTSVATPDLDTAHDAPAQLSPQTENTAAATNMPTLSQHASDKLILLAHELAAAVSKKNTLPTMQASNGRNPTVLAMQSLRNFIADPVKIPAGAVGLEQVKSLLMSTTLPKELSQTTLSERNRRVLLPLQLLIATLPRGQLQQGMALAKLDSLVTTHSRDLT